MARYPVPPATPRSTLATVFLVAVSLLFGGACRGDLPETPVRTTTAGGSWTAPSAAQAADRDRALLRIVSAIPGGSRLDLFVDGQKLGDALEYKAITPYMEVPSGRHAIRLRPAGMDTADPLADESQQLRAGRYYTAVIMPGDEGRPAAAIRVFDDPMDVPDEGRASLRVVHAAADAGRVDVHVQGRDDPLASALDFQAGSAFTTIQPPAIVELRPAQRTETMLRLADLRLSAGGMYTVIVIGRTRIEPPLETLVLEDRISRQ
ncbi:hypothetical protein BH23ACI1_BH23ACI1_13490 [soil metagenome]|nr:DUF4397 domain-containing protein [Acidobacteriota bacterium]